MADLESQISILESERDVLQIDLASSQEELKAARDDANSFAESMTETQTLYQQELVQHGKSMESLFTLKEQVQYLHYIMQFCARKKKKYIYIYIYVYKNL